MKAARTRVPRRAAAAILTTAMLAGCGGGSPQPPAVIDKPAVDRVPTRVHQLIVEQLGADEAEVSLDAHLRDDLGADSLDMVELTMALEEEFGREIADAESATFVRVRDIVEHLRKQGVLN